MTYSPARETLDQIHTLDKMAMFDWGTAQNPAIIANDGNTLRLKSAGMVPWKGYIDITYNRGTDLYDLEFYRMRRPRKSATNPFPMPEKKLDHSVDSVFFDQLVEVIDRQVLKR